MLTTVEQTWLAVKPIFAKLCIAPRKNKVNNVSSETNILKETSHDFCNYLESFELLVDLGLPCHEFVEEKLCWLRSQIIGNDVEFNSPFGRRKLVYADYTASGRSLHYIENFITNHLLPFYGNTHTCDSYVGGRTTKMLHEASEYIKKCLGGGEDDAIIFCGSGTTAAIKRLQEVIGIAVPSILRERVLRSLSKEERWVVFVGPHEHHSNLLSWRQSLAEVVEIGLDDKGLLDMEALKLQLEFYKDTNRPMLGSFSACSNVTGIYSDTRAIARLLHQYKGFACFDFAASGPHVEIDMKSREIDEYDAVFISPHKFLGGPDSPGVLLMNKILYRLKSSPPSTCGGGTVTYVNDFNEKDTIYLEDIEEREKGGTPPIIQIVRTALAFWVKEYINYEEIEKRENFYINKALKRFIPNPNIEILGNLGTKRQAILSFVIYSITNIRSELNNRDKRGKILNGSFVATLLNDLFGIQARGGCACAGPYGHYLLNINKAQSLAVRAAIQEGDKIQATVRKTLIPRFETTIREGVVYNFRSLGVVSNSGAYRTIGHQFKLNLQNSTMVRELETSLVTASPYSLISFPEIRNVDMDYLIDVMGILVGVGQDRVYERNGVTTKFKVIELESDGIRIECALFGSYVDELDAYLQSGYNQNVVVLAQFLKVKMFNGKSQLQNAMNCTKLLFNPEIPESVSFKLKHSHNFDSPTQPLTHKKDTSHLSLEEEFLSLFQRMTIEELKDCQNDMVCVVFGTVKHILGEGDWWYGACVCNKGVVIESKRFFCSKCKKYVWTIVPRYRIKVRVVDDTDSATFVIFDHDGISLTNKSCLNLLHEMDQDPQSDTVPKEIGDLVEKQFLFKIEAKNDVNSNFEKSFRVKKLCGDLDIIKKFKYVAVEKVDAGLDNDIEGGVTNDLNNKFEEEATDDKYQVPNSVHVPIPVEYDSDDCTPLKRGFIEVADDNDGVNSKNVKNVKIEKE